jgi:hypothetical protein
MGGMNDCEPIEMAGIWAEVVVAYFKAIHMVLNLSISNGNILMYAAGA